MKRTDCFLGEYYRDLAEMTMAQNVDYRLKNLVNFFALKIMTLMVSASPIAVVMVVDKNY